MSPNAQILPRHNLSPTEIAGLEARLYAHNQRAVGREDGVGLGFVAVDAAGAQVGAVAGYSQSTMTQGEIALRLNRACNSKCRA
jgi:hypothetical protein